MTSLVVLDVLSKSNFKICKMGKRKKGRAATTQKRRKPDVPTLICKRQEKRACKFVQEEGKFDSNDHLTSIICLSCMTIIGRRKVIVLKFDNLEKHEGKCMCLEDGKPLQHLKKGSTFYKDDCKHTQNCKLWASYMLRLIVVEQLVANEEGKYKKKGVHFSSFFNLFFHGHPMFVFESQQCLFKHLKLRNLPQKHWLRSIGQEMNKHLHLLILTTLKCLVQSRHFISINTNEVIAIDSTT